MADHFGFVMLIDLEVYSWRFLFLPTVQDLPDSFNISYPGKRKVSFDLRFVIMLRDFTYSTSSYNLSKSSPIQPAWYNLSKSSLSELAIRPNLSEFILWTSCTTKLNSSLGSARTKKRSCQKCKNFFIGFDFFFLFMPKT